MREKVSAGENKNQVATRNRKQRWTQDRVKKAGFAPP